MKKGPCHNSSPLDDIHSNRWTTLFTTELLELLRVLEVTLAAYPDQARRLQEVVAGECVQADEFPPVPEEMRKPPRAVKRGQIVYEGNMIDTARRIIGL